MIVSKKTIDFQNSRIKNLENELLKVKTERDIAEKCNVELKKQVKELKDSNNVMMDAYSFHCTESNISGAKIPECINCVFCEKTEMAHGKVLFSCKFKDDKMMFESEAKTSPKWCPLRPLMSIIENTKAASAALTVATKTLSEASGILIKTSEE